MITNLGNATYRTLSCHFCQEVKIHPGSVYRRLVFGIRKRTGKPLLLPIWPSTSPNTCVRNTAFHHAQPRQPAGFSKILCTKVCQRPDLRHLESGKRSLWGERIIELEHLINVALGRLFFLLIRTDARGPAVLQIRKRSGDD